MSENPCWAAWYLDTGVTATSRDEAVAKLRAVFDGNFDLLCECECSDDDQICPCDEKEDYASETQRERNADMDCAIWRDID